jgi:DNA-binding XRE family transcriptional regulator
MASDMAPESDAADRVVLQADLASAKVREQIKAIVRAARQGRGLTQEELGKEVGASRFTINRIEAGATDLTLALAEELERALKLTELRTLVAQRDRLVAPSNNGRDSVVARLLGAPDLYQLRVVLADETDIYSQLFRWVDGDMALRAEDIQIVVPTARRERELFGDSSPLFGHIEQQLKRMLALKRSDRYAADSLRIYESDDVVSPMIIAEAPNKIEGAVWPPIGVRNEPGYGIAARMPVGVTADQQIISQFHSHIDWLIEDERKSLRSNEALCEVAGERDPRAGQSDPSLPVFTRYFTIGEDQEEDVDDGEGIAVALILMIALCPRKRHGIARRVITFMRPASRTDQRRSLFSNAVEDIDIQRARATEEGLDAEDRRSTRSALEAALDINEYLEARGKVIPDEAFRYAAARVMSMYDLDLDLSRFEPVPLPPELRLISKTSADGRRRAAIAPRLFVVELKTDPSEFSVVSAKAHGGEISEVGKLDLAEEGELNDFLDEARNTGFLAELLTSRGIADR